MTRKEILFTTIFALLALTIIIIGWVDEIGRQAEAIPYSTTYFYVTALVKSGGVIQEGQTVYFGVMRASDQYWYDFSDSTFKNTGWTTQNSIMGWNDTNSLQKHYYYIWTKPTGEEPNALYIFFASTSAGVRMCDAKVISSEKIKVGYVQ